jgi:chromosome segregation protein
MYLKKLDIQGFKSFAQKAALEFPDAKKDDKGITAIVGPNGSGKSNISDAIRWVLGEQSMKTLRGKKADDLIFSGSDKKSRLGFAEVSLHLDNSDHIAPVDYEEIVITRRLYRNGEGEYLLNKKPVRLADILMMLAKAKFAQKTYSVIGQGMIDSILVAPPAERKEFFDEAAGVKEFQIKRNQSLNKLKGTQTNLQQVDIMLQEIEPRLRSLTRQVKRLERREEVEKDLKENQIKYYSSLISELESKIKEIKKHEDEISPQIKKLQTELAGIQKKLDDAAGQTTRSEAFAQLQGELNKLVNQKNNLLREQAVLKGKLDVEYTKSGQINLVWLEKRKDEVQNRIKELEEQMKINVETQKLASAQSEKKDKLQQIELEVDRLKGRIEELGRGGSQLDNEELKHLLREIVEEQKKLVEQIKQGVETQNFASLQEMAEEIYQKIVNFRDKFSLASDSGNIADELEQAQDSLSVLQEEKRDLLAEIGEINVKLKIDQEKKALLQQEIDREKAELEKIKAETSSTATEQSSALKESQVKAQSDKIGHEVAEIDKKISQLQAKIDDFNASEEKKKTELIKLQREYSDKQNSLHALNNKFNEVNIELTKLTTRQENILQEAKTELKDEDLLIKNFSEEINRDSLYNRIQQQKHQLELIGGIDDEVVKEYKQIKERYEFLHSQTVDLKDAIGSLEEIITQLDTTIKKEFNSSFEKINHEFEKYFKILFNGGKARLVKITEEQARAEKTEKELALEEIESKNKESDQDEAKEKKVYDIKKKFKKINVYSGVEIQATPPGKKLSGINMLSGGERALTSIALICAIISCNPSPFVVLDEVDAALDEANSDRFASILHELAHKTQFIAITHNRATMHQAKVLYGVTMGDDGVSKLLSVKMEEAEKIRSS